MKFLKTLPHLALDVRKHDYRAGPTGCHSALPRSAGLIRSSYFAGHNESGRLAHRAHARAAPHKASPKNSVRHPPIAADPSASPSDASVHGVLPAPSAVDLRQRHARLAAPRKELLCARMSSETSSCWRAMLCSPSSTCLSAIARQLGPSSIGSARPEEKRSLARPSALVSDCWHQCVSLRAASRTAGPWHRPAALEKTAAPPLSASALSSPPINARGQAPAPLGCPGGLGA
jgi:hypothetical protein